MADIGQTRLNPEQRRNRTPLARIQPDFPWGFDVRSFRQTSAESGPKSADVGITRSKSSHMFADTRPTSAEIALNSAEFGPNVARGRRQELGDVIRLGPMLAIVAPPSATPKRCLPNLAWMRTHLGLCWRESHGRPRGLNSEGCRRRSQHTRCRRLSGPPQCKQRHIFGGQYFSRGADLKS